MSKLFNIAIIGSGILGASLAYILSLITKNKIVVIEQESNAAYHTSSRNSGKVHAPFLYDPVKKGLVAKIAYLGFDMWKRYANYKNIPFKIDGVLEVAVDDSDIDMLERYIKWGEINGLKEDLIVLDDVREFEPEVRCVKALYCKRDASTNYKLLTLELVNDAKRNGVTFLFNNKVKSIHNNVIRCKENIEVDFLINAAGGASMKIAHDMNIATDLKEMYFRGEYWKADKVYSNITRSSVYSVPKFVEYPFLDPHWLVKVDGSCEVGPNAVPVLSPYGYDMIENLKSSSKLIEMLTSNIRNMLFDKEFLRLAKEEWLSSLSKKHMIERVKRFLPRVREEYFNERGISGIRSLSIDKNGKFLSEPSIRMNDASLHILNYNSPGATGALPFAIYVCMLLERRGIIRISNTRDRYWDISSIVEILNNTII
ncbi:MAG: FAD-dependent oxidoreductase [Candidatus Nitrosocaldaceae archaeon]